MAWLPCTALMASTGQLPNLLQRQFIANTIHCKDNRSTFPFIAKTQWVLNTLASLEATLVRNYVPPTEWAIWSANNGKCWNLTILNHSQLRKFCNFKSLIMKKIVPGRAIWSRTILNWESDDQSSRLIFSGRAIWSADIWFRCAVSNPGRRYANISKQNTYYSMLFPLSGQEFRWETFPNQTCVNLTGCFMSTVWWGLMWHVIKILLRDCYT